MCDTMVIVRREGVWFAKNSDRDPNEGQNLEWHPRRGNLKSATLRCTYIEIPDVDETFATLLSRPFWMWGAEMGSNEHGVTIGNEAVFTKVRYESTGLLGMDLLRLALERAETAERACQVITELLEQYGQGGGCGHESKKFTYHNSFIVADPGRAFVLETAGRAWAVEEVRGARTISNGLTIPDFAEKYSDFLKTRVSACRIRQKRTQFLAEKAQSVWDLMQALQDHGQGNEHPVYAYTNGGLNAPCAHGGGVLASSQTTASWVADLRPGACRYWVTATAAPCTGLFKPVSVNGPLDLGPRAEDRANGSLWWRHERLHRMVARDPAALKPLFDAERIAVQRRWLETPPHPAAAFREADDLLEKWTAVVAQHPVRDVRPSWTRRYWAKRNKRSRLESRPSDATVAVS